MVYFLVAVICIVVIYSILLLSSGYFVRKIFDNPYNDTFLEENDLNIQRLLNSIFKDNYSCIYCIKSHTRYTNDDELK
jgi:hypothetical protein